MIETLLFLFHYIANVLTIRILIHTFAYKKCESYHISVHTK